MLQYTGTFEGGVVQQTFSVVPGSGTEELSGLKGEGSFESGHTESYPLALIYDFEENVQQ